MPGFPCCCTGCDIASDEFDRASVGSGWTQVSGSWSISSNRLETSDSDALAIFVTDHPEESSSHHISVLGQVSDTESKIRGIVAYDSADNYLSVELMINSSDCSEIKFFERVGGSTSQVGTPGRSGSWRRGRTIVSRSASRMTPIQTTTGSYASSCHSLTPLTPGRSASRPSRRQANRWDWGRGR